MCWFRTFDTGAIAIVAGDIAATAIVIAGIIAFASTSVTTAMCGASCVAATGAIVPTGNIRTIDRNAIDKGSGQPLPFFNP
jgi:hypothetical protein